VTARDVVARAAGKPVRMSVERAGSVQEFTIHPRDGRLGVELQPIETCGRIPVGEAVRSSSSRPVETSWLLVHRPKGVDVIGPIGIALATNMSPCAKRLGYVMCGSVILLWLAVLSLPVSVVLAVRAARRARSAAQAGA